MDDQDKTQLNTETLAVNEVVDSASSEKTKKRKIKRNVSNGIVHIMASFNNTIVSFTDNNGALIASSSAGTCGFRGSKKGTAYAAQVASEKAGQVAKAQFGFNSARVKIKGIGLGRDSAVRALAALDIHIESIEDVTGVPHGGVRSRKARRV